MQTMLEYKVFQLQRNKNWKFTLYRVRNNRRETIGTYADDYPSRDHAEAAAQDVINSLFELLV